MVGECKSYSSPHTISVLLIVDLVVVSFSDLTTDEYLSYNSRLKKMIPLRNTTTQNEFRTELNTGVYRLVFVPAKRYRVYTHNVDECFQVDRINHPSPYLAPLMSGRSAILVCNSNVVKMINSKHSRSGR